MALITKYGSFWGMLPQTTGRYFWVAPSAAYTVEGQAFEANDGNAGLSPELALRTVTQAMALATASVGDVIVLLPGTHTYTATLTVAKAGLTIVGIPGSTPVPGSRMPSGSKRQRTRITCTATAGIIFTVTAADCEFAYLDLIPVAAGGRGFSLSPLSGAANRTYIHDCSFTMTGTASVTTYGVTVPAGVTADLLEDVLVQRCYFLSGLSTSSGANGPGVNILGTAHGFTVEQSTFQLKGTAAWAAAILGSQAGTLGTLIRECDFLNPTSATTVITTAYLATGQTVDGSSNMYRCYIPAGTDGTTATASADVSAAECYQSSIAGGTLMTAS